MGITIQEEPDDLTVACVTGSLKKAELESAQVSQINKLQSDSRVKLLIIVENFSGWERGANWGDLTFYSEHGHKFVKIAIVGDPVHEADFMMFLGAGIRSSPVRYFPPDQLGMARAWLADSATT